MQRAGGSRFLKRSFVFVLSFVAGLLFLLGLGMLRFHSARLAYRLESIERSIQRHIDEETALRQELSALVAPIKIYSYCKEHMGMQKVTKAESLPIRLRETPVARRPSLERQGWRVDLAWLFGE